MNPNNNKVIYHLIRMALFTFLTYLAMPTYSWLQIYAIGIILYIFYDLLLSISIKIK